MTLQEITKLPTIVTAEMIKNTAGCHESVLQAYNILQRVKAWLDKKVPQDVILELILEMEEGET